MVLPLPPPEKLVETSNKTVNVAVCGTYLDIVVLYLDNIESCSKNVLPDKLDQNSDYKKRKNTTPFCSLWSTEKGVLGGKITMLLF